MMRDAGALLIAVVMVLQSPNVAAFICGTCARVAALLSSHTCAKPKPYSPSPPLPLSFLCRWLFHALSLHIWQGHYWTWLQWNYWTGGTGAAVPVFHEG